MKAAFLTGPKQFIIKDVPKPTPDKSEVLVKVKACAICGSDLTMYKYGVPDRIFGHEFAGEVVEIGADVKKWKAGDRVVIEPQIACGECYFCKQNRQNLCLSGGFTGLTIDGALAEFVKFPAYQLHRLPDEISYEHGAMIEPMAVALRGVQVSNMRFGDSVAVFGLGAIGLFSAVWAKALGADKIIATEVVEARIKAGKKLVDVVLNPTTVNPVEEIAKLTDNIGPRIIYECTGDATAQNQAIEAVQRGGKVILLGMGYEPTPCMFLLVSTKEVTIKGSVAYASLSGFGEFPTVIQALKSNKVDISSIPILKVGLNDVGEAFEASLHGDVAKAIVVP